MVDWKAIEAARHGVEDDEDFAYWDGVSACMQKVEFRDYIDKTPNFFLKDLMEGEYAKPREEDDAA
jgi:hypothetical protein